MLRMTVMIVSAARSLALALTVSFLAALTTLIPYEMDAAALGTRP
jgi:hypothetical protein